MSNLGHSANDKKLPGVLALEDGTVFRGRGFGSTATTVGEAVFNTSMTGYQEVLTDPSYAGQIVCMTASQIGNYGVNSADCESSRCHMQGFVIRELSPIFSNWRAESSLSEYLTRYGIPGVEGIDTRYLTLKLRDQGAMKACISTEDISDEEAVRRAREWGGLNGVDYVAKVTADKIFNWDGAEETHQPFTVTGTQLYPVCSPQKRFKVVAYDLGAKYSIFRKLQYHGFEVVVVPANTSAQTVLDMKPQALFLSNGPGDPSALPYVHQTVATLIQKLPTFGICLGHQMIGHALGGHTFKLKFGHRGGNQPVKNLENGKVSITSQNHGYAFDGNSLDTSIAKVTEINLNDQTVEGLRHLTLPVFSVQYHPEAAPGPNDADPLFSAFYQMVEKYYN
jgi:carbamoyl-phosphate synthase small subunit